MSYEALVPISSTVGAQAWFRSLEGARNESMAACASTSERVYHETQVMSMCGVHCLNTLLQANAFNEVDLAQIAHELDRREREVMAEGGITSEDYLKVRQRKAKHLPFWEGE